MPNDRFFQVGEHRPDGTTVTPRHLTFAGDWSKLNVTFDRNSYWRAGGGQIRFGDRNWHQWQKAGMDVHSKIADPHFASPAGGDFTLRTEAKPALAGFKPFDLSKVGPR
jgi:hypothetical protein